MSKPICCKNCWAFDSEGPYCRRHAPKPRPSIQIDRDEHWSSEIGRTTNYVASRSGGTIEWPYVSADDWCGEFEEAGRPKKK